MARSRLFTGLLVAALSAGCSALFSAGLDDAQCTTDADCERETALRGRVCRERFCVALGTPASTPRAAPCISAAECTTDAGSASVCREGRCVRIVSDECRWVSGDFQDPNAIFLGAILPTRVTQVDGTPVDYPYAERVRLAEDLAVRQWAAERGIKVGAVRRPFVLVQCDDAYRSEGTKAALSHLLDAVGAQGLLLMTDDELAAAYDTVVERKIAVVCSDCVGPEPAGASQSGLIRRILPPLVQEATLAVEAVKALEIRVRAERSLAASDPIRVAFLAVDDSASRAYATAVTATLAINGRPAGEAGSDLRRVDHPSAARGSVDPGAIADDIIAFQPHIVLVSDGSDFATRLGPTIEAKWPGASPLPYYVPNELALEVQPFSAWIGSDEARRRRIVGVAPAVEPENARNIEAFRHEYEAAYGQHPDESQSGFDAFHALAYAVTVAAQLPTLRGADIATSFERLLAPSGSDVAPPRVDVGALGLAFGPPVLLAGGSIDLVGLWNGLDWRLPAGDIRTDSSVWCLGRSPQGDLTLVRDGGLRVHRASGSVSGAISCP